MFRTLLRKAGLISARSEKRRVRETRVVLDGLEDRLAMSSGMMMSPPPVAAEVQVFAAARTRKVALSETQKTNLQKLSTDLQAIAAKSTITDEQKQALATSIAAMINGATAPNPALVQQYFQTFKSAVSDGQLTQQELSKLRKQGTNVLKSASVPQSEIDAFYSALDVVVAASNVTQDDVKLLIADLKAIVTEAKKNFANRKA